MTSGIWLLILPVVLVGGIILWDCRRSRQLSCVPLPRPFRGRKSQEATWWKIGDDALLEEADDLLSMLCEAFSFHPDDRYQFAPTDRIMDVYSACYPRWMFWRFADATEIESLMMDLSRRSHFDDEELTDIKLREIVVLTESPAQAKQDPEHERK